MKIDVHVVWQANDMQYLGLQLGDEYEKKWYFITGCQPGIGIWNR